MPTSKAGSSFMDLHVVLFEPEIPQNTGNIARTCAAVGASLHLVEPLGFSTEDRYLKRAGLDYWSLLETKQYASIDEYFTEYASRQWIFATKSSPNSYSEIVYHKTCSIIMGNESSGLPPGLLNAHLEKSVRIPMKKGIRSLNLSNATALIVYEALRQNGFPGLQIGGDVSK